MLKNCNNKNLDYRGVNPELKFFYQRWQELLYERTLDMYQYNLLNSCVACIELTDVIDKTLSGLLTSRENVLDSQCETFQIIKNDETLKKYDRSLWVALMQILSTKIKMKKVDDSCNEREKDNFRIILLRLKYQLEGPCRSLKEKYLGYILDNLRGNILLQNKPGMQKLMCALISQCIYNGWSANALLELVKHFEGTKSLESKIESFIDAVSTNQMTCFEIYCSVKIETRSGLSPESIRQTIKSLGINIKKGNEIQDTDATRQNLYNALDAERHYIISEIDAYDPHTAAVEAVNTLNKKLSVATFFNTVNPYITYTPTIIVFDSKTRNVTLMKITDIFRTYDHVDSANDVFEDTKNIISSTNMDVTQKLESAFSYTNLSRTSYYQETKFITLWIALESIMRTGTYPDIISHVKKILPPAMSVSYFYKLVRNFAEDCLRCAVRYLHPPIDLDLTTNNKRHIVTTLISVFRDNTKYPVLLDRCNVNDLLSFRCQELHDILNDSNKMKDKIKHYKTKIEWHIQRLYRIRNEITHSALQKDRSLVIYIEHLYSYLSQLISEIVHYIEHKNVKTIEEAYALLETNYNTFIKLLENDEFRSINDVLPTGRIDLF